jgi:hypothetical protein
MTYPSHAYWLEAVAAYLAAHQDELVLWLRRRLAPDPDVWRR